MPLPRRAADVVVIGGGVMGASTAYHLARRGASVVLLEKAELFGSGATGWNAGGIRHQFSTAVNIELSKQSITMLKRFGDEMDQPVDLNFCGYLFLLDNDKDVEAFRRNIELQHQHGIESRFLGVDEIRRLVPLFDLEGIIGGTFYEGDGIADPSGVLQGYVSHARRLGAELLTGVPVTGIRIDGDKVRGVTTPDGAIDAPCVVIAAGPWSADVGRLAGVELPVAPIRRQILVTRPIPGSGITRDFPFTIDFSRSLYFHYESGGILTGMSNHDQLPGFDVSLDKEWREIHLEQAMRRLPLLADAAIASEWAGLYEVTPDDQPILGRLPQAEGLIACTGFSGHGFMHGPVAGLLMAEEILDGGAHTVNIDPLRWQRFESGVSSAEYNVV